MPRSGLLVWVTTLIAVYHLVVVSQLPTWFRLFIPHEVHLAISLSCALVLIFLLFPASGRRHGEDSEAESGLRRMPWYDVLLLLSGLTGAGYVIFFHENILDYGE